MSTLALETVHEVFDLLGTKRIAAVTGASYRRAFNWKARERFPPWTINLIKKELESQHQLSVLDELFGIESAA